MSQKISGKIGMLTPLFNESPKNKADSAEFYKNKYIEELEHRVQTNESLAQKDELISKLLTRIRELEGHPQYSDSQSEVVESEESDNLSSSVQAPKIVSRKENVKIISTKKSSPAPVPAVVKKVETPVSVKKVVTPQQKLQQESSKVSPSSAKKVETENEEAYTDLDGDPLVAWNDVIKVSHPGSLGQMTALAKQRLEFAFSEFLAENIALEKVKRCKTLNNKNNVVVALPESLIDSFGEWLDEKTDQGMLDKGPLAKWKEEQAKLNGKSFSPKRRESGKVQVDKTVVKKKSVKENQGSFPGWIPWVDIIRKKFPDLNMNLPQFVLFVKAFVLSNSLEEKKLNVPGVDVKVLAIPEEMANNFLDSFTEKFKYMKTVQAVIDRESRGEKRDFIEMDDSSHQPRKLAKTDAKQTAIKDSGLDLYNKYILYP